MGKPFQSYVVKYGPGDLIFKEGDVGATMFIVQAGKVRLFRSMDGQRQDMGVMEKGDFFGEMSILEGLPRTNSAEAAESSELIEINSTTFDRMVRGNIEIAIRLMRKLSLRLRDAERRLQEAHAAGLRQARQANPKVGLSKPAPAAPETGARLEAAEEGVTFALVGQETLIGRFDPVTELSPDVDLTEVDLKRSVSRRHARIVREGDAYQITEEVGALNGTFVNGEKLAAGEPHALNEGDEVGLGMVKLRFNL